MKRRLGGLTLALALLFTLPACAGEGEPSPAPAPLTAAEAVAGGWSYSGDLPDVIRVEIALPVVREDLPGAEEVNGQIDADYGEYAEAAESSGLEGIAALRDGSGFAYPFLHLWYEAYSFGDIIEVCIIGEEYSLYGSGPSRWVSRYYYHAAEARAATEAEFLAEAGYSEESVLAAFLDEQVMEEDPTDYTYEDIRDAYYIDGEKNLHFWVSLYA